MNIQLARVSVSRQKGGLNLTVLLYWIEGLLCNKDAIF